MSITKAKAELSASEISNLIEERIASFDSSSESNISGKIVSVRDGIIRIHGLCRCSIW